METEPVSEVKLPDGATLSFNVRGTGRDVLFVSGLGGNASVWDRVVASIGGKCRSITFDQRGIGKSTRGTSKISTDTLAEDGWRILDKIGEGRPILVGHSMGGAIVQAMQKQRPDQAAGLVISGSWAGPNRFMTALFRMRLDLLEKSPQAYASCVMLMAYPADWLNDNWDVYENASRQAPESSQARLIMRERTEALLAHDLRRDLPNMKVPALVIGSADDQVVPSFLQDELIKSLPTSQAHRFEGGGHGFTETRPEAFSRCLESWMAGLDTYSV
ncbi:MAG: alpha/beta fold hydrolase [Paracoccaceae bacterium]